MTTARPANDVAAIVTWLVEGAPTVSQPQDVLQELCDRLAAAGLPLHRVAVFVTTLHPDIMGRRLLWRPGEDVLVTEADYAMLETDTYRRSPVRTVFATAQPIRLKIADPGCPQDYGIVEELRVEGVSDYLIQPLPFTNGMIHAVSWTTTRAGGFADSDLAAFDAVRLPLARLAEIYALRRTATNLLDTYVGRHAGLHILQGRIRRGDIERIEAVIVLTDLRGFTTLSNTLPGDQVLSLLNRYFDCLVPPIVKRGGEVLKFIGDGLLAIFPVADSPKAACARALAAALEARATLEAANAEQNGPALRQGMALHLGEVLYGNIGSTGRLDFTAIGPAVNLAARLESVARDQSRDLVMSAAFGAQSDTRLEQLGRFELKGFREAQEVFVPATEQPR